MPMSDPAGSPLAIAFLHILGFSDHPPQCDADLKAALSRPWFRRGALAANRMGFTEGDIPEVGIVAALHEMGAHDALRAATALITDPAIRGREAEAIELLKAGHSHAEIREKLGRKANAITPLRIVPPT
jgi:hypothetical protein